MAKYPVNKDVIREHLPKDLAEQILAKVDEFIKQGKTEHEIQDWVCAEIMTVLQKCAYAGTHIGP